MNYNHRKLKKIVETNDINYIGFINIYSFDIYMYIPYNLQKIKLKRISNKYERVSNV